MTLWTVTLQAPLSMKFSRQEYWSGLPFPASGPLPRFQTHVSYVSCVGRWVLYQLHHLGSSYVCGLLKVKLLSDLALGIGVLRASTDEESP